MSTEKFSEIDKFYMKKAIQLAKKNLNLTGYDPAVGCVVVKNGQVISEGSHKEVTTPHAEKIALRSADRFAVGADLYINLEPCAHWGNNPPCVESIIKAGIKKVYVAIKDPNPLVNGRGIKKLKKAGIKVITGLLQKEAKKINEGFFKFIRQKIPFVTLKIASSLDGKIATSTGESKWLTSKESRKHVHYLRSIHRAVMVGTKTILKDNPSLTVRYHKVRYQPLRVILDAYGRIPLNAQVFDKKAPTLLIVSKNFPEKRKKILEQKGIEIKQLSSIKGFFNLNQILKLLGEKKITSLLVEGGGELLGSFLEKNLADKVIIFLSPIIIGGQNSLSMFGGKGIKFLKQAHKLKDLQFQKIGRDLVIEGYFF